MSYQAVLFDLDGTLLNTIEDLCDAMNAALDELGCPTRTLAECLIFVGDGLRKFVLRSLPENRHKEPTVAKCCELFGREYAARWRSKTRPYDGVVDLLAALKDRGLPLAVLSNKPDHFTREMASELLGETTFRIVRGVGEDGVRKPDPAGALAIAEAIGVAPQEFLYVGDTDTDMQTADAAGMYAVGVTWGFRPAKELLDHGAMVLIDHPSELLKLL